MSITSVTVTHKFALGDGSVAAGQLLFKLTSRLTNGPETLLPSPITATLDGTGSLSQPLAATDDAGTVPTDVRWQVTVQVSGTPETEWVIAVPSGSAPTVDLMSLVPSEQQI